LLEIMDIPLISQNIALHKQPFDFGTVPPRFWRNGLIVRMPNHLGDAVMALPALMQLKKLIPEHCGLFVVTPKNLEQLYHAIPAVDEVVSLEKPHRFWTKTELRQIKKLYAGAALLFNHSLRDVICFRMARVPQLYGAAARGRSLLLTRAIKFPAREKTAPSHQCTRYLTLAYSLGASEWDGTLPDIKPSVSSDDLPPAISALCRHPQLLLLAACTAYSAAKRWPQEYFRAVAGYWIRHGGVVAILGTGSEVETGDAVRRGLPEEKCFNLCGQTDIYSLIHLFRSAAFSIANDTGLMHLGAVLGTRGIVVFGPTDFTDTGPITPDWKILTLRAKCAPCLARTCPSGNRYCMEKLTAFTVIRHLRAAVKKLNLPFRNKACRYSNGTE